MSPVRLRRSDRTKAGAPRQGHRPPRPTHERDESCVPLQDSWPWTHRRLAAYVMPPLPGVSACRAVGPRVRAWSAPAISRRSGRRVVARTRSAALRRALAVDAGSQRDAGEDEGLRGVSPRRSQRENIPTSSGDERGGKRMRGTGKTCAGAALSGKSRKARGSLPGQCGGASVTTSP